MKNIEWNRIWKQIFTFMEFIIFVASIYITFGNKSFSNLLLLFFFILATLGLSGCTYTSCFHGRWCTFMAKLSLPIYLFHWNVGLLVQKVAWGTELKLIGYYVITLVVSILAVYVVENVSLLFSKKYQI